MTLEDALIFQVYGINGYSFNTGTSTLLEQDISKTKKEKESESENQNPVGTYTLNI